MPPILPGRAAAPTYAAGDTGPVRRTHQRLLGGVGAVVFAGLAVTFVLRGGTLTQIAALLGTPWAYVSAEPTVLFLDEVNERPYRLDRLLWQLRAAGVLERVVGVVLNELPGCDEPGEVGHVAEQ